MTNAKNSFGLDVSETETDFLTITAATPPVLASTVSKKVCTCTSYSIADNYTYKVIKMSLHVLKVSNDTKNMKQ